MSTSKEIAMALTLFLGLGAAGLRAQTFTAPLQASTTGTNPVDFEFRADGTLIAKGNLGVGSLLSADQGAGTRLLWYPARGAFRAGMLSSGYGATFWDAANIGQGSAAFGQNTMASGSFSIASGQYSTASGLSSVALGDGVYAPGYNAVAIGSQASATGAQALALGYNSNAVGGESFAVGSHAWANGYESTAIGYGAWANGTGSLAFNHDTTANGAYSAAFGVSTTAAAYNSFVVGTYNVASGNPNAWVGADPLFEVGNGTYSTPSDAFVVYKNGSAKFSGVVQVQPGGDIPMYTGN